MGRKPKFEPSVRAKIVELAKREGAAVAARTYKTSRNNVARWVREANLPPARSEPAPKLKSTKPAEAGYPFGGDPGERSPVADHALNGHQEETDAHEEQAGPTNGNGAAPSAAAPGLTGEAVVELAQTVITLAGHVAVTSAGTEFTAEHEARLQFSPGERAALLATAPHVARYLDAWLSDAPLVGAVTFAGTLVLVGAGKVRSVQREAQKAAEAATERERETAQREVAMFEERPRTVPPDLGPRPFA